MTDERRWFTRCKDGIVPRTRVTQHSDHAAALGPERGDLDVRTVERNHDGALPFVLADRGERHCGARCGQPVTSPRVSHSVPANKITYRDFYGGIDHRFFIFFYHTLFGARWSSLYIYMHSLRLGARVRVSAPALLFGVRRLC